MDTSPVRDYPRLCIEVGLTCEACTSETARQVSKACKGLHGKSIGQLFVQIYPHSACAPMHAYFAEAYRAASSVRGPAREPGEAATEPETPRRGPARERRTTMVAAVA